MSAQNVIFALHFKTNNLIWYMFCFFCKEAELICHKFKCFTQHRIKWLSFSNFDSWGKYGQGQVRFCNSLRRIISISGIYKVVMRHDDKLCLFLHRTHRLINKTRNANTHKVLSNQRFENFPYRHWLVRFLHWQLSALTESYKNRRPLEVRSSFTFEHLHMLRCILKLTISKRLVHSVMK